MYKCPLPPDGSPLANTASVPADSVARERLSTIDTRDNSRTWLREIGQRTGKGIDLNSTVTHGTNGLRAAVSQIAIGLVTRRLMLVRFSATAREHPAATKHDEAGCLDKWETTSVSANPQVTKGRTSAPRSARR